MCFLKSCSLWDFVQIYYGGIKAKNKNCDGIRVKSQEFPAFFLIGFESVRWSE